MRQLPNLTKQQWAGFAALYLAGLGWLADIIIPFTSLPNKVLWFTVALAFAETMFLIGVALLGKAYYKQIKAKLTDLIRNGGRPGTGPK